MASEETSVREARTDDFESVSAILIEAAAWLEEKGLKLWERDALTPEAVAKDPGTYFLVLVNGKEAACFRYQEADLEYWDDVPHEDSHFVHRVAVKRRFAGTGLAKLALDYAKNKARKAGKNYLRLDCIDRPSLRRVYENEGFKFHSVKHRTPYNVIRYEFDVKVLNEDEC